MTDSQTILQQQYDHLRDQINLAQAKLIAKKSEALQGAHRGGSRTIASAIRQPPSFHQLFSTSFYNERVSLPDPQIPHRILHPVLSLQLVNPTIYSDPLTSSWEVPPPNSEGDSASLTFILDKVNVALENLEERHRESDPTEGEILDEYELLKKLDEVLLDWEDIGKMRKSGLNETEFFDRSMKRPSHKWIDSQGAEDEISMWDDEKMTHDIEVRSTHGLHSSSYINGLSDMSKLRNHFNGQSKSANNVTLVPKGYGNNLTMLLPKIQYIRDNESENEGEVTAAIENAIGPLIHKYISLPSSQSSISTSTKCHPAFYNRNLSTNLSSTSSRPPLTKISSKDPLSSSAFSSMEAISYHERMSFASREYLKKYGLLH